MRQSGSGTSTRAGEAMLMSVWSTSAEIAGAVRDLCWQAGSYLALCRAVSEPKGRIGQSRPAEVFEDHLRHASASHLSAQINGVLRARLSWRGSLVDEAFQRLPVFAGPPVSSHDSLLARAPGHPLTFAHRRRRRLGLVQPQCGFEMLGELDRLIAMRGEASQELR